MASKQELEDRIAILENLFCILVDVQLKNPGMSTLENTTEQLNVYFAMLADKVRKRFAFKSDLVGFEPRQVYGPTPGQNPWLDPNEWPSSPLTVTSKPAPGTIWAHQQKVVDEATETADRRFVAAINSMLLGEEELPDNSVSEYNRHLQRMFRGGQ